MGQIISIELTQTWSTLDDAVAYFKGLANDLTALKRFEDPPTDLFFDVEVGKDPSEYTISIRNL